MEARHTLTNYVDQALAGATYDKLEDGTFAGHIPSCVGVVAFGQTLRECEDELHSTLEDWVLVGLKLGHSLPVIADIDLNQSPVHEPLEAAPRSPDESESSVDRSGKLATGAELVAFWQRESVIGSRPDIEDSQAHARAIRERAEHRTRE